MMDYAMPFMIQYMARTHKAVTELQEAAKPKKGDQVDGSNPYLGQIMNGNFGTPEIAATAYNHMPMQMQPMQMMNNMGGGMMQMGGMPTGGMGGMGGLQ